MTLAPEVQNWLNTTLATAKAAGVPDDKLAVFSEVINQEKVADLTKQSVHAASDYSRKMDAIRNQEQILTNYESRLGAWKSEVEAKLTTAQQRAQLADEYETKLNAARAEITRLHQDGSTTMDPATLTTKGNGNGSSVSTTQGITPDTLRTEIEKVLAQSSEQYAYLPAICNDITREHQKLFGELPEMQPLIAKALKLGQPLTNVWEMEYKVSDRRQAIAKEAEDERVSKRVEEVLSKELSNLSMQGHTFRTGDPRSPVLSLASKQATTDTKGNGQAPAAIYDAIVPDHVKEAVDHYNKGTYQVKFPGQS